MSHKIEVSGQTVKVTLTGSLYVTEATSFREEVLPYAEVANRQFHVDMSKVDYIDSSGLGVLVALHKRAVQNRGLVVISGLHGAVKELFELTRLNKVFELR